MHRSDVRRSGRLAAAAGGLVAAVVLGGLTLAVHGSALATSGAMGAVAAAGVDGVAAGNAAIASVDLSGTWSFTPAGRATTSIAVPGGGWYKQGFTDVNEAVYSRSITVPDSGQPQSTWIEFGAVNHQATLSVDGRVVATQTTAFTPSNFDISAYAAPGTTHTISGEREGPRRVEGIQRPVPGARRRRLVRGDTAGDLPVRVPAGVPGGVRQRHIRAYVGGEQDVELRRVGA